MSRKLAHRPLEGVRPHIYVASLSDYNAGHLHGVWIDAGREPKEIMGAVERMLARSSQPHAEEWAIHDFEGFGAIRITESTTFEAVSRMAHGIARYGDAFSAWIAYSRDTSPDTPDRFEKAYLGRWESFVDFAQHVAEDRDLARDVVECARPCAAIDPNTVAQDLSSEFAIVPSDKGGIHVFVRPA